MIQACGEWRCVEVERRAHRGRRHQPHTDWAHPTPPLPHPRTLQEKVPVGIIHPNSHLRLYWDMIAIFLVLFIAIMLPYRLAFARSWDQSLVSIDFFTDLYFMFDIVLNFQTAYFDDDQLIVDRKLICINYIKTWFIIDIIATFPVDWTIDFDPVRPRSDHTTAPPTQGTAHTSPRTHRPRNLTCAPAAALSWATRSRTSSTATRTAAAPTSCSPSSAW